VSLGVAAAAAALRARLRGAMFAVGCVIERNQRAASQTMSKSGSRSSCFIAALNNM